MLLLGVVISELKTYITNTLMKATIRDPDYLEVKIGVFKKGIKFYCPFYLASLGLCEAFPPFCLGF